MPKKIEKESMYLNMKLSFIDKIVETDTKKNFDVLYKNVRLHAKKNDGWQGYKTVAYHSSRHGQKSIIKVLKTDIITKQKSFPSKSLF